MRATCRMAPTSVCAPSPFPASSSCTEGPSTASAASCRPRAFRACTEEPEPWSWGTYLDTLSTSSLTPSSATCWGRTTLRAHIHVPSGWQEDWQVNVTKTKFPLIFSVSLALFELLVTLDISLIYACSHRPVSQMYRKTFVEVLSSSSSAELDDGSLCTKLTTKEKRSEQTAGRIQSADSGSLGGSWRLC